MTTATREQGRARGFPAWRGAGLILVVLAALALRLGGLEWDDGTHPHPDERFMTMVASALHAGAFAPPGPDDAERGVQRLACAARNGPRMVGDWFDTGCSDFNPANAGHPAYPYGLLPLAAVRALAESVAKLTGDAALTGYGGITVVGRIFSAACDVLTLLATFVLGRLLWNRSVGLLAAGFYALAVLPIQASHFFTVDATLTLFSTAAVIFLARLGRFGHRADAAAFGVAFGLALACKISIAPLALLLPLAVAFAPSRLALAGPADLATRIAVRIPEIALAGIAAFVAFRIAAPNAFAGPAWYDVAPSRRFVDQTLESIRLASGDVDIPPNWQWLGRPRFLGAAKNLLLWGLGPALGLAALFGIAGIGAWLLRRGRRHRPRAVAWLFAVGYFALVGAQWVSSMRYLLPIYPVLCVFAAAWLVTRARLWRLRRPSAARALRARLPALGVLAATALFAVAFHRIHTALHPYVAATHWMLRAVEAPVSAQLATPDAPLVNWPAAGRFGDAIPPARAAATRAPASGEIGHVRLHRVTRDHEDAHPTIGVRILDAEGRAIAETMPISPRFGAHALTASEVELPLAHPVRLAAGRVYQIQVVVRGGALALAGSAIAEEGAWNDAVPARVPWLPAADRFDPGARSGTALRHEDGVDPFAQGYYVPVDLGIASEDDAAKRERLIDSLARAEWLVVPNGRFLDAVARNPLRFPLTTRFYDALFEGRLGFTRVAVFASLPSVAGVTLDDQAVPRAGEAVTTRPHQAWAAEEAFSVYDHPSVHVFRKDAAATRATIASALPRFDLVDVKGALGAPAPTGASRLAWSTREASFAPDGLLAPARSVPAGDADVLDKASRTPMAQVAYTLAWYVLALVLGLVAWPWLAALWPDLPDRGYGVARIAGLLVLAVPAWWLASLGVRAWSGEGLATIFAIAIVVTAPFAGSLARRARIGRPVLRVALGVEAAFLALFVLGILLRLLDPDLWAPALGGEKPMDFALFRAVISAAAFPPADPWFAGGRLNYYYFGFVLAGALAKLAGTPPAIAYNLALPLWFAMTGVGAGAIAFDAGAAWRRARSLRAAWVGGAVALAAVALLGNLDLPRALAPSVASVAREATRDPTLVLAQARDVVRQESGRWLWSPTRTVAERPGSSFEVNEFPAFTFLFGDLHAHLLALPLQLLALGAALAMLLASAAPRTNLLRWIAHVAVLAVPIGLLRATNAWDWPLYLLLGAIVATVVAWRVAPSLARVDPTTRRIASACVAVALLLGVQALVAWPFRGFVTGEIGLRPFTGMRTPLLAWLAMQGWFVVVMAAFVVSLSNERGALPARALAPLRVLRAAVVLGIAFTAVATLLMLSGMARDVPATGMQVALLAWLAAAWVGKTRTPLERVALGVAIAGFGLALAVEFVVVSRDLGRMNTFFKAHMQSWLLLSVASGMAVAAMLEAGRRSRMGHAFRALFAVVTLVAAAYVPFGLVGRAHARFDPDAGGSLDGEAFLEYAVYDYEGRKLRLSDDARLIRWLRRHADPGDVVLEAQLPEYRWGSRISTFTSRPTLLGYRFHESQQRPIPSLGDAVELRKRNVFAMYASTDAPRVLAALGHYGVRYVVVGALERAVYPAEGLAKFAGLADAGRLAVAYRAGYDVIYRVNVEGDTIGSAARF